MITDRQISAPVRAPVRVLIVEDSKRLREQLGESISCPGRIEIVGYAETEAEALELFSGSACDAVVLDLQLRQGNGLAVLQTLRASTAGARVTVIVLTNFAYPHFRERSLDLGANYFFDKAREYDRVREVLEELAGC